MRVKKNPLTISDFSPIPFQARHFRFRRVEDRLCWNLHDILTVSSQLIKKNVPDLASVVFGEFAVIEGNMDAGDESVVEGANAVGCQKEDALTVFHCAEEAYANFVSIVTVFGTNLCKDKGSKKR